MMVLTGIEDDDLRYLDDRSRFMKYIEISSHIISSQIASCRVVASMWSDKDNTIACLFCVFLSVI